ncbi:Hypothetical protein NTJ_05045 [Nesidiocoris tenuis]|nr:Hypothetical protein NTJ_05045 [Nesidiocoris tenuis]
MKAASLGPKRPPGVTQSRPLKLQMRLLDQWHSSSGILASYLFDVKTASQIRGGLNLVSSITFNASFTTYRNGLPKCEDEESFVF